MCGFDVSFLLYRNILFFANTVLFERNPQKEQLCSRTVESSMSLLVCSVSAGVGRTGCFIVIEAMLEKMKHERSVDIYGHVTCMRVQRNYMVQTEDQYKFIHEALLEAATCGNTEVPARNLYSHIQRLSQIPAGEAATMIELEFKVGVSCFDWMLSAFGLLFEWSIKSNFCMLSLFVLLVSLRIVASPF